MAAVGVVLAALQAGTPSYGSPPDPGDYADLLIIGLIVIAVLIVCGLVLLLS